MKHLLTILLLDAGVAKAETNEVTITARYVPCEFADNRPLESAREPRPTPSGC